MPIMGPNGSGKSTLAHVLSGRENYQVTGGEVIYNGKNLLAMSPEIVPGKGFFWRFNILSKSPASARPTFLKPRSMRFASIADQENSMPWSF